MDATDASLLAQHAAHEHHDGSMHHHHTHAGVSRHEHGHHLLQVEHLSVSFRMYDPESPSYFGAQRIETPVIRDMSISVHAGEIIAVVGASGSGKTLLADSIMGLFERNAQVMGRVWFDGELVAPDELPRLRGNGVSFVPQSVTYLDPLMRVGRQVRGRASSRDDRRRREARQRELFARYGLADDVARMYPHELSGGMARRVLLCCALMDDPRVIIADEPTPGLDMEMAVRALDDFRAFADAGGGVMLITHDIELALRVADRVAVFRDGTVVEETAVESFKSPELLRHPFSRELWHALPGKDFSVADDGGGRALETAGRALSPSAEDSVRRRLEARGVTFGYPGAEPLYRDFDFAVAPGERVALRAPSGFGKTTLCRILAGYVKPNAGEVLVDGTPLPQKGACPVQLIWQHPERVLDPRMRLGASLEEAFGAAGVSADGRHAHSADAESRASMDGLMDALGIQRRWLSRYPHELSGGEMQRFCIARALASRPRYVVCDETTAMLDAVTQARIWRFLTDWCENNEAGMVFVSHSDALVGRIATRVVELG